MLETTAIDEKIVIISNRKCFCILKMCVLSLLLCLYLVVCKHIHKGSNCSKWQRVATGFWHNQKTWSGFFIQQAQSYMNWRQVLCKSKTFPHKINMIKCYIRKSHCNDGVFTHSLFCFPQKLIIVYIKNTHGRQGHSG